MNASSKYLDELNERQREAVEHTNGSLLIVAGAGAGKTKTITHRIAHLIEEGVHAHSILAVTFTNKAAGEMRERVRSLLAHDTTLPTVTTFHSFGVRLLREFYEAAGLERGFTIWDRDDSMRAIKRILEKLAIEEIQPRVVLSIISRQKGDSVTPSEYAEKTRNFKEQTAANAWKLYEEALREENALDFDDLLVRTLALLRNSPETLEKLRNRYQYITVDEYQDTNTAQFEIVRLLAGPRNNICVVGDMDQCIYSWRGARPSLMLTFEETYPGAKIILLEQNYRSSRTIIAAANAVIVKNAKRRPKNLFTNNDTGEPITHYSARNEIDESWFVAQMAARLIESGTSADRIGILYRENVQSRTFEDAMLAYGVPYRVLGTKYFDRKEVKDVLSYLRAALNPKSKVDLARIVGTPPRGIGKVTLEKMLIGEPVPKAKVFYDQITQIRHAVETLPASEAVRFCIEASGLEKHLSKSNSEEDIDRLANIRELVNVAVKYDHTTSPDGITQLLEEAVLQSEQDNNPEGSSEARRGGVSLMTVHASKGLEFDAVFVTGLEQGLFPSVRDDTRDNEEERRLFYVAITRAREQLFLSSAQERMKYGARERALPSEFLGDIDERLVVNFSRDGGAYGSNSFEAIIT